MKKTVDETKWNYFFNVLASHEKEWEKEIHKRGRKQRFKWQA